MPVHVAIARVCFDVYCLNVHPCSSFSLRKRRVKWVLVIFLLFLFIIFFAVFISIIADIDDGEGQTRRGSKRRVVEEGRRIGTEN